VIAGITLWIANTFFALNQSWLNWLEHFLIAAIVCGILLRYLWLQQQLRNREQAEMSARLLEQEIDLCQRYIAIESVRLSERLTMKWIQKNIVGGTIRFTLAVSKNVMTIYISNPLPENTEDRRMAGGNKMAHQNIQQRLASQYGSKAKMRVDQNSANNNYEIILTLPINKNW